MPAFLKFSLQKKFVAKNEKQYDFDKKRKNMMVQDKKILKKGADSLQFWFKSII